MPHSDPGNFLDNLGDDEKLVSLMAFNQGLYSSLSTLVARLNSFYSLLEFELDSSPAGQIYHREGAVALNHAALLLGQVPGLAQLASGQHEPFDLRVLLRGIATRIGKIGLADLDLEFALPDEQDCQVAGNLHLLQHMLFALPYLFGGEADFPVFTPNLYVQIDHLDLDDAWLRAHPTALVPGPYYAITVNPEASTRLRLLDAVPLGEKLSLASAPPIGQRLIFCHGVALHHGGDLLVPKSETELQTLTWLIPHASETRRAATDTPDSEPIGGTGTILLVDDEDIIWDVVIDMLQGVGYTVILAANGRDCVEIYAANPGEIDLVLLDMVMPEMNGHEAFFALKALDPNVRVLLQSGYVAEEDAREVLDAGARGFLQKPYRMAQLAQKIHDILHA